MNWWWFAAAMAVWLVSAGCILGTLGELFAGKAKANKCDFWGGVVFHAVTAIAALWLLTKALA